MDPALSPIVRVSECVIRSEYDLISYPRPCHIHMACPLVPSSPVPLFVPQALIVKKWAKSRNIADASTGTLSSYCWVLMTLHYCQIKGIVPSLQDPKLRHGKQGGGGGARAGSHLVWHRGRDVDVWFSTDSKAAGALLVDRGDLAFLLGGGGASHLTLGDLVTGFFQYYAHELPFATHTVRIDQVGTALKQELWPRPKLWRFSIQGGLGR